MAIQALMPIQPAMIVNKGNMMNLSGQPMASDLIHLCCSHSIWPCPHICSCVLLTFVIDIGALNSEANGNEAAQGMLTSIADDGRSQL